MSEALVRKKKVRAGHRSSATRIMNQLEVDRATEDGPTLDRLQQYKLTLKEKLETLNTLDQEILALVEDSAIEDEIEQADVFKERLQHSTITAERLITSKTVTPVADRPSPRTLVTRTEEVVTTMPVEAERTDPAIDGSSSMVKLPKLTPRKFNGNLTKWETFWSSFESSIHLNTTLTAVDKFNYLNSLLEGPALAAVAGLKLTTANYAEAIDTLKKRFGNKQQIISRHMDTLLELESVTSSNNTKALRRLYDQIEFQVRSLKSLEVPLDSYGNLLSSLFMSRLPQELRLIVSREVGEAEWRIDEIMNIVEREISAQERAFLPSNGQPRVLGLPTATALMTGDGQPKCSYCRQGHSSVSCSIVTDVAQRKHILKKAGRCFVCLKRHHLSRNCRSPVNCTRCNGRHHTSICKQGQVNTPSPGSSSPGNQGLLHPQNHETSHPLNQGPLSSPKPPTTTQLYCVSTSVPVFLQTAKAYVYKPNEPGHGITIRLMLDGGSQRSYITQRAKQALGLEPERIEEVQIKTFGSDSTTLQTVEMTRVAIALKTGNPVHVLFSTVPLICEPLSCQPIAYTKEKYRHLAELDLADFSRVGDELQIDALIGSDHYWQLVTGTVIQAESGPTAIQTHLGWVLSGPVCGAMDHNNLIRSPTNHMMHVSTMHLHDAQPDLSNALKAFWELESLGIKLEEPSVYEEFKRTISFKESHYEVCLPWKSPHVKPSTNRNLAKRRLEGLLKKLHHLPEVLKEYHAVMQEQLRKGIIEKVVDEANQNADNIIHYLPHHAVIRKDKQTTKLRIVYDASARGGGCSLNDCLHSGPKFDQNILDIILRFRAYRIGVIADVEKAFLMVSVCKEDRDALRFLWVDDIDRTPPAPVEMRFTRVVFGVSASPFLLNATLYHHIGKYQKVHPKLVDTLLKSIYVDDVTYGANTEEDAYQLYTLSKKVFAEGGFNLQKFVTSSATLRQRITDELPSAQKPPTLDTNSRVIEEDITYTSGLLEGNMPGGQKVLGVSWNPVSDVLEFDIRGIAKSLQSLTPTKRNIIGFASRFYDPLGFLAPVIIQLKVFFQELCKSKLSWDDPLPSELSCKWKHLLSRFQGIVLSVPRCYFCSTDIPRECVLYGFCDASTVAYAAVVYLCIETEQPHFVASKTRVSPLTQQTIPRLELLSCLLLARLITHVQAALATVIKTQLGSCFTDSKVALFWIRGKGKEWKQFVYNRVKEIRELVPPKYWSHCPGKENPADLPSRGVSPKELEFSAVWRHGPDWLPKKSVEDSNDELMMPEECVSEMKAKECTLTHSLLVSTEHHRIGQLIHCDSFSGLQKLLRVTVYVRKFALRFKSIITSNSTPIDWTITAEDMERAEMDWVTDCQRHLTTEVKFDLWKSQLNAFLDQQGVWRCGGRLNKANISYSSKHPILLSKQHHLTTLITQYAHERTMHGGVKDTLTEIRSKYWIVKGRQFVRKIIYKCVTCRKVEGPKYRNVPPPPLPEFRVKEAPPFAYCGVDFAGPLYIRVDEEPESRKVWICLYTCCVTRAVHLELLPDMSAQTFLRSFKRFTARRGTPLKMISDNAKTFISAAQTIEDMLASSEVQQYVTCLRVKWSFTLEKAPWWGGFYERMIQSMKRCLKKTIGKAKLTHDELSTALTEVEAILNSRPLSYISSDDLEEPLTPSHMLTGRRILSLPDGASTVSEGDIDFEVNPQEFHARVRNLNDALDQFWDRWRNEYLLQLRERYPPTNSTGLPRSPIPGEVVLIHDEHHPRTMWRLARVCEVITSSDGEIRGASLVVSTNGKLSTLRRPLSCLYPLEAEPSISSQDKTPTTDEECANKDGEMTTQSDNCTPNTRARPIRAAASKARQQVHQWMSNLTDTV